jgi:hypothetical protein
MGEVFIGEIYLPFVHHPGDVQRACKVTNIAIQQKSSAGINSCSFGKGIFFLPSCPNRFKVTAGQNGSFS